MAMPATLTTAVTPTPTITDSPIAKRQQDKAKLSLTTLFTPPASCTDVVTMLESPLLLWKGGIIQTGDADCFPPRFKDIFNSAYSPGICPSGWTSAASFSQKENTVTDIMCCPSGFVMTRHTFSLTPGKDNTLDGGFFCASSIPGDRVLKHVITTSSLGSGAAPTGGATRQVSGATLDNVFVWQDVIQVKYESTDKEIVSLMSSLSSTATGGSVITDSSTDSPTSTSPTATSSPNSDSGSKGISSGAIAGIAIGAAAAVLLISAAAFFLFRRRRRAAANSPGAHSDPGPAGMAHPYGAPSAGYKSPGNAPSELGAGYHAFQLPRGELDGVATQHVPPVELPGSMPMRPPPATTPSTYNASSPTNDNASSPANDNASSSPAGSGVTPHQIPR